MKNDKKRILKNIKERSEMDHLIQKYMVEEKTPPATNLKYTLILELINKESSYINLINYVYDIQHHNQKINPPP